MSAPLFMVLERAGIHLSVSSSGELKAKGKLKALHALLPTIRESKTALIAEMEAQREAFEERAAIIEYDGVLSREEAERFAKQESFQMISVKTHGRIW